jgi:hypothetical protein
MLKKTITRKNPRELRQITPLDFSNHTTDFSKNSLQLRKTRSTLFWVTLNSWELNWIPMESYPDDGFGR